MGDCPRPAVRGGERVIIHPDAALVSRPGSLKRYFACADW
jgi:hypothetical protein